MPLVVNSNLGNIMPSWTTATRPSNPSKGQLGFNTTLNALENYNGATWSTGTTPEPGGSGNVLTSNGTEWANALQQGLGYNQTWSLPTRSSGTTYTNSTSRPIFVMIAISGSLSGSGTFTIVVGGTTILSASYGTNAGGGGQPYASSFIVPAGATYVATVSGDFGIGSWSELR
jgi:hypothetical protein